MLHRLMVLVVVVCVAAPLLAETTFPSDPELNQLAHPHYYTWGLDWTPPADQALTKLTLTYRALENLDEPESADHLYTHLLPSAPTGVTVYDDQSAGYSDDFTNWGEETLLLGDYSHPDGSGSVDVVYEVPLRDGSGNPTPYLAWVADGNFGIGIDPDCLFVNGGIGVGVGGAVPEPSVALLGLSALGISGLLRRRKPT